MMSDVSREKHAELLMYCGIINSLTKLHLVGYCYRVKNIEILVVAGKEIGLEVNAVKTKYMVMSRDRNAGRRHSIKADFKSFERMGEFKYLRTTLTL